jgi:ABC-type uncharacterized transport system permease subunit
MNRNTIAWILSGIASLVVGAITVWLGRTLMPARTTAETVGTIVPWFLTWGMIWMTALIALIMAINLFAIALNSRHGYPVPVPPDSEPARSTGR